MNTFLQISFGFPTLIWTALLLFSVLYWLVAMIGMADFDVVDLDLDIADGGGSALTGLMATLGLTGVPFPVVLTSVTLGAWVTSYFGDLLLLNLLPTGLLVFVASALLFIVSLLAGAKLGALMIKPLKGLFKSTRACSSDVLGATGTAVYAISRDGGTMDCTVNGAQLRLQVRSVDPIAPGEKVVVIRYQSDLEAYQVVSEADFIAGVIR